MTNQNMTMSRRTWLAGAAGVTAGVAAAQGPAHAAEAPASGWRIGCYTRPWADLDYRAALDAIAEAGYREAGLMTTNSESRLVISVATSVEDAQQVGEACRQRGLAIASAYGGPIPVQESVEAGVAGLMRLIDNCAAAGAANLLMGGVGDDALYEPYYTAIRVCCPYAREKGVGISVKPHGGLNATGPQCRKIIDFVGHVNFRVWYDPGNIFYYSDGALNPVDDAATVDGLVVGMSVKDYRHPKIVDLNPGTGQVDFPAVMQRLKAGGFTAGPLVVECLAPGTEAERLESARTVRAYLERLIEGLGHSES